MVSSELKEAAVRERASERVGIGRGAKAVGFAAQLGWPVTTCAISGAACSHRARSQAIVLAMRPLRRGEHIFAKTSSPTSLADASSEHDGPGSTSRSTPQPPIQADLDRSLQ
jgi:hypothetical protein